jgi:polyferredoxin
MNRKQLYKARALLRNIRSPFVAIFGLILPNSYFSVISTKEIYSGPLKQVCVPGLNCHACPTAMMACPMGMIQQFAAVHKFPFAVAGFLGIIGIVFGRSVCGWLCPFGWVQDQIYRIKSKKFKIPTYLKYGKYFSLVILALILPYFTEANWFSRICPWGTLIAGVPWVIWNPVNPMNALPVIEPGSVGWLYVMKVSILVIFLALFVFTRRPFCRTLCPLGAIYSQFNKISFMRLEVTGKCVGCDMCVDLCPVEISVADDPNSPDCIRCLNCTLCNNVHVRWGPTLESGSKQIVAASSKG